MIVYSQDIVRKARRFHSGSVEIYKLTIVPFLKKVEMIQENNEQKTKARLGMGFTCLQTQQNRRLWQEDDPLKVSLGNFEGPCLKNEKGFGL